MQSKNIKKLNRLLYLLNQLDGGEVRVSREAQKMYVTERTIQRDLRDIEMGGFPIYKAASGMYKLMEGFSLKKMDLTDEEASLLLIIQDMVDPLGKPFQKPFERLRRKYCVCRKNRPFISKYSRELRIHKL